MRWLREDEEFRNKYTQAREDMIDFWMMESRDIAEDRTRDYQTMTETTEAPNGVTTKTKQMSDNSASMRDRLRVDAIHKAAARMLPKKYGDKVQQEITGKDGGPLLAVIREVEKK